jgi:protocatechuate 3,4-dioxygenase beta subunit
MVEFAAASRAAQEGDLMKRAVIATAGLAAAIIAVVAIKCSGSSTSAPTKRTSTGAGTSNEGNGPRSARAEKPDPRTAARGSIHGAVTAKGGGPIAGAQVCAQAWIRKVASDETRDPKCTMTDAQGTYAFDELYAGSYWLTASAATYRPGRYVGPKPDRREDIVLAPGERRDGIDLRLEPGGVEVRGTVADVNGGPIAEAWVEVTADNWLQRGGTAVVRSGADGTYTAWAAPGTVRASASADGYAEGSAVGTAPTKRLDILLSPESVLAGTVVDAATKAPVAGATVEVSGNWEDGGWGGGNRGRAISDDSGKFRITRLAPGRYKPTAESLGRWGEPTDSVLLGLGQTVEGVVIPLHGVHVITGRIVIDEKPAVAAAPAAKTGGASGAPVAAKPTESGAGPSKLPGCGHGWLWLRGKNGRSFNATTEANGDVRIEAILPDTYTVNARCDGYSEEDPYPDLVITDADVTDLEWKTHPASTLRGTMKTSAGEPVAQAQVNARMIGGDPRGQRSWESATTEDDGTYEMRALLPGEYTLEPYAADNPAPKEPAKVTIVAGQDATADLVLDAGGAIAGVVVDDRGQPVSGAQVNADGGTWEWMGGNQRSGDDGRFEIKGLRPGSYRVNASRGWRAQMRKPGSTDDDVQGERTTVTAGQTASVRLVVESQSGMIGGTVSEANGAPVADAFIVCERESDSAGAIEGSAARQSRWGWWGGDQKPVVTDSMGAFKVTSLSPGTYTVRAYRKGGGEAIAEHVAVGSTKTRLMMKPTGSIGGVVTLSGGSHPADVSVAVSDAKSGFSRSERFFRTDGRFAIKDLPPGELIVRATAAEGQVDTKVILAEGENKTGVALELVGRVTITGRVVSLEDRQPIPGMTVMARPVKGGGGMPVMMGDDKENITDAEGRFTLRDAPAGRVRIQAFPIDWEESKYSFVQVPRTIPAGATFDVGDLVAPRRQVGPRDKGSDLGFDLKEQPPDGEPEDAKLEVSGIRPDGPAVGSGLVAGDIITTVNGHDVTGANTYLAWSLWRVPVGTTVKLGLARNATVSITSVPEP